jgi:hypothetical protein
MRTGKALGVAVFIQNAEKAQSKNPAENPVKNALLMGNRSKKANKPA